MVLYLIRHGQTDWNLQKKIQGIEDVPLNQTGMEQAARCGEALKTHSWDVIYTSPLSRASETAQIISQKTNQPPVIIAPGLIERDFGEGSGLTYEELHKQYPDYPHTLPKGMESFEVLKKRIYETVLQCAKKHPAGNIILISHGGSINALLYQVSQGAFGTGVTYLKNTCICQLSLEKDNDIFSVPFYNLTPEEYQNRG